MFGPKHCLEELWTYILWISFPYRPFSSNVVPHLQQTKDSSTSFSSASSSSFCWAKPEAFPWQMGHEMFCICPRGPFPSILLSCLKPKDGLRATVEMPVLTVPTAAAGASQQTAQTQKTLLIACRKGNQSMLEAMLFFFLTCACHSRSSDFIPPVSWSVSWLSD